PSPPLQPARPPRGPILRRRERRSASVPWAADVSVRGCGRNRTSVTVGQEFSPSRGAFQADIPSADATGPADLALRVPLSQRLALVVELLALGERDLELDQGTLQIQFDRD